jgi:phage terminase large subunit
METVGNVILAIDHFKPHMVVIDDGGLGAGVVDRLKEQRYTIRPVNFANKSQNQRMWGNKRSEMWGAMRQWLETASLPKDRFLRNALLAPRQKVDSKGSILLESKKDMKARGAASPDEADAIAMTFAYPVARLAKPVDRTLTHVYDGRSASTSWMGS